MQQLQDHLTNVYEKTVRARWSRVMVKEIKSRPFTSSEVLANRA